MLQNKKILIGITGSIAAYKIPHLIRLLVKAGAEVKVIITPSAKDFVSPLSLSTVSKNNVLSDLSINESWANHVMLGRWADVFLIAPLSCNTLAKMAIGQCDNLLMAVYLSSICPVIAAPAMDEDMWHHPSTQKNILTIKGYGNTVIPVETGELASGLVGQGRMAEPENILKYLSSYFEKKNDLKGINTLVTAGPTYEAIDPVRFVGNHSSGKMGISIAKELVNRGANVTLILGPSSQNPPAFIKTIRVSNAASMLDKCLEEFATSDITVMSAAVADYTPVTTSDKKIKKDEGTLTIELKKTVDILKQLGLLKKDKQTLVGFALETNNEKEFALNKLKNKNADMIVLNSLKDVGAGFGVDTNKITIFDKRGGEYPFEVKAKGEAAVDIVNAIVAYRK